MKREYEYIEGQKARENFDQLETALFRVPKKQNGKAKKQPKAVIRLEFKPKRSGYARVQRIHGKA